MADPRGDIEQTILLDGEVWAIEVGQLKQRWNIHQGLLCKHSAFFQSAVKKEWSDGAPKTISLPDDDVDVFEIYAQWLYQGKLLVLNRSQSVHPTKAYNSLLKCYIFGEKIQDAVFQNTIIDGIIAYTRDTDEIGMTWHPTDGDLVYEGTPEGSPLRMLIVDMFVYHGHQHWIESQCNADFFVDLTKKLLDLRPKPSGPSPVKGATNSMYHKAVQTAVAPQPKLGKDSLLET